jgi:hypothetical protein
VVTISSTYPQEAHPRRAAYAAHLAPDIESLQHGVEAGVKTTSTRLFEVLVKG